MTQQEELAAYRAMQKEIEEACGRAEARIARCRAQGKQKTASCREALAQKLLYKNMLDFYRRYGLAESAAPQKDAPQEKGQR